MTQIADRVREVSTSSSTGPMTLAGTVVGFRRFRDVIVDGATVPYVIENGAEWEVGYGSFTAPATLNRVTVKASSNGGAKVDFSAGQKSIWIDAIADLLTATTVAVSSVNGQTGTVILGKSDVGLGSVDNTSDANKPVSTATQTALNAKVESSTVGAANGLATLGADSKLTASQIPAIAIVSFLGHVANQAAMLALSGQSGDWCIRDDLGTTWIITGADPSVLANWTQLSYPTAPVTSVAGKTGAVTLASSDVGLGNVDNTSDVNKPISTATQTALNAKANNATTLAGYGITDAQSKITATGLLKGGGAGSVSAAVSGTDYVSPSVLGAASGVATLGADSKLTASQIPDISIVTYLGAVASQAAMLALVGQQGDWCTRTDLGTSWIITGNTPSILSSWTQLAYPTAPVTSVAGKTGSVTLSSVDVGLGNVDNTSDATKNSATATLTNKTVTGLKETKTAPSISAGTLAMDCSAGNVFAVSLNANITTLSFSNVPASGTAYGLTLSMTANGTAYTVTWPASVKWPSGTAPTLTTTSGKVDTFVLATWDGGTTWYAFAAGQNA